MPFDFLVGFGIEYFDGGAPAKLADLARKAGTLHPLLQALAVDVKGVSSGFWDLSKAAMASGAAVGGFDATLRANAATSRAAESGARGLSFAYMSVAASATAAAGAVARLNAMSAGGAAGFGAGAAFAAPAGAGRGWQNVGAGLTRQMALPSAPTMKWAGASPLATGSGWASPWASRLMGPPGAGSGGTIYGTPAFGRGAGGGFGGGGGGGGMPPGGGFGGIPMPPVGGVGGMMARAAVRTGVQAVKYGAEAGLGLAWDAIHEAGRFQTIMTSIQNVTGANAGQMEHARGSIFDAGDMSGTSPAQSAEMFREIARQSQGAMSFDAMLSLLPQAAKMQVVLGAVRGFSPTQTVDNTMALVHLFRQYDPKGVPKMMDTVLKMGELMPSNLSQAVTQMGYFLPTLKSLHVSNEDAATMMIAMSRFGMGRAKGGSSLAQLARQALGPLQMTTHAQKGKALLLGAGTKEHPGLDVLDKKGNSRYFTDKGGDIFGFLDKLADYERKHGSVMAQQVFQGAFGTTGTRLASVLADPIMIDQLHKIHDAITKQKSLGLDAQSRSIFGTAQFAEKRSWQNFQAIMTEVGTMALPAVTKGFWDLGNSLHDGQKWLHDNRSITKRISDEMLADVQGVEKWMLHHHSEWEMLRNDAIWAFDNLDKVGHSLEVVGDKALAFYKFSHWDKTPADQDGFDPVTGKRNLPGYDPALTGGRATLKAPPDPRFPFGHPQGTPPVGPTVERAKSLREPLVRRAHEHHRQRTVRHELVIRHQIDGPNDGAKHALKTVVGKALEEIFNGSSRDQRSASGRHGSIPTSPRQPTRLTTPNPP
jgi:hypothetical protein